MTDGAAENEVLVEVVHRVPADRATGRRGCVVVRPRGAVVAATVATLTVGLDRALHVAANVVVDLSAVTAVDSAGIAVLVSRSRDTHANGFWLVLTRPSPAVRAALDRAAPRTAGRVDVPRPALGRQRRRQLSADHP